MKILICLLGVVLGFQTGGCATILNGTTQDVSVSSDPPGAEVTAGGNYMGVTPIVLDLQRKTNHVVTVSMDGYHTEQISVTKVMSGAVAGNILAGGFIGWGIDASSGAQYKLKPDTITVSLKRLGMGETDRVAPSLATPEDRLRQLDKLVGEGVITEAEYQATRKQILAEIASGESAAVVRSEPSTTDHKATEPANTEEKEEDPKQSGSWIYDPTEE